MACPSDDTLLSWRSGRIPADEARAVEEHVDQCAGCQAVMHAAIASFDASRTEVGAPSPPAPRAPGELVAGRYRIVHFVGSGGMGTVYAAVDEELGQPVALKTLHERFASDPHAIMRLKREALLARRITHANVCRIFDVGYDHREGQENTHPPQIFLTMELLRGETLRQRLQRGRLRMSEARPLVEQLAAALAAAHAGRVIHRDLKSDNVILIETETGTRAVVTDFGLARAVLGDDTRLSRSGALIGTPAYMAPEQILAGPVDTTVDIYALGVEMFEMLTGELPFGSSPSPSPIKERLMGRPRSPRTLIPELSASWERVVMKCLEPEPGDRFARVDDIVGALDAAAPPRRRSRAGKLAITMGALTALGLIALVGLTRRTPESAPEAGPNRLFRVTPSIAPRGATVTLDGLFGSEAEARFAGAAPVRMTAIGPHHATVQVPASARSGEIAVMRGNRVIGAAPFRQTSFPLGAGVFTRYYAQVAGARWTPALTTPREYQSSVVIGDFLYLVGGYHDGFLASVARATINADGSLSSFSIMPNTALQTPRDGHASVVIGDSLYVIGGNSPIDGIDTIERATITADGSLSPFSTLPNLTLNRKRAFHACEIVGDSLYVIGGVGMSGERLASVERTTIREDGSLGPFSTLPVRLSTPRSNFTSIVSGRSLYVIGGARAEDDDDVEALSSVERATILPDGSLSPFTIVSQLAIPRGYHSGALLGDELYVFGGRRAHEWLSSVERATLHPDGSLGPFAILPRASLSIGRASHTSAIIGDSIYVIGGAINDGHGHSIHRADIEYATVNARGELAPPSVIPGTLAMARSAPATVVADNSLYLIGGFADRGLTSVEHARILADGSLSPWEIAPDVALIKPRRAASSTLVGDWLYIIGGTVDDGLADATVELARFERGLLSSFSIAHRVVLATPRSEHASVVIGEWIYVLGGVDPQGHVLSLSERARIGESPRLSSFTPAPELALTTPRRGHSVAVVGDWVYVIGGADAEQRPLGTIERARIRADGTLDRFAPVPGIALTTARRGHSNAIIGGWLYVIGGENGEPLGSIERAAIGASGELGPFSSASITLRVARGAHSNVVLGNSLYVLGGHSDHPLSTIERLKLR